MSGTAVSAPARAGAGPAPGGARPRHSSWARRRDRRGLGFVSPFLVVFGLFMIVPLGYAVYDSLFWSGVVRVIVFGAIQIPVMLVIAFFFATAFDLGVAKYGRLFRTIFFIPFAVDPARLYFFDPDTGQAIALLGDV